MKENTKQILKVCFCTVVALILFVGVILMCIYFAFDNTNSGVARAEETSSEELLFNDERTILIDEVGFMPFLNNCIYVNSSFDFSLLEIPFRSLIDDNFAYDDIFTYPIARIYYEDDTSYTFQYLYIAYWEGNCHLILSTDEYVSYIESGSLLGQYDSYDEFRDNILSDYCVWYLNLFVSETEFIVDNIYHYENYFTCHNLGFDTIFDNGDYFDSFVNCIINTSPYFVDDFYDGVLYVPLSEDSDLTINPYLTKTDYYDLSLYLEGFSFGDYIPSYNEDEDFYSFVDAVVNGLDFSFGYSFSAGEFAYLFDGDFYFLYQYPMIGPFVFSSYEWYVSPLHYYRYEIVDIKPLFYDVQHYLNYELEDGYCSDLGLVVSSSWGYLTSSYIYASRNYDDVLADVETEIEDLQQEIENWKYTANNYYQQTLTLQQQITTLQQEKSALQQQVTTLQQEKSALQQQVTSLQQDNSELQNQITQLQSQITDLQNQIIQKNALIDELQHNNNVLQDTNEYLQRQIDSLEQTNSELEQTNSELQAELNRYKSAYESIGWFDVLSSSLNNVALIDIDGYKSTYVDVQVSDGTDNLVNVWNLDENPGNGTAFAVVLPRYFGNGTRFRFSYNGLIGSASGMANLPASLGYINSTGNLITIMELPVSSSTYVEFNISEEMNTFVIYTTGNLIVFEDFKFQVFSFDEIGIYDDGFADGRDEGIKYGEKVGYENGYADAREKYINNDYSFFALFSSVLDAPLQMIIGTDEKPGMLNFYIPGLDINIAPFLLSLFSVALVITIIRFILARAS